MTSFKTKGGPSIHVVKLGNERKYSQYCDLCVWAVH